MRARDDTLHRLLIVITLHANKVLHQRRFRTHTRAAAKRNTQNLIRAVHNNC